VNPHTGSNDDVFVAKVDSDGVLVWNTFMGGEQFNYGNGIAIDSSGNVYVTGDSYSNWGSPVNPYSGYRDAFVAKLDSDGASVWNTFMGTPDTDSGFGIAVDSNGHVYVTGASSDPWGTPVNPHTGDSYDDAFVAKLDTDGVLLWNTFMGGEQYDDGNGIAVDSNGNVYVTGASWDTWGTPVNPHSGSNDDVFVAKLDSEGVLVWNAFMGGKQHNYGYGIAIDSNRNVYVTGESWDSPVNPHTGSSDAFVAKIVQPHTIGVYRRNVATFFLDSSGDGAWGVGDWSSSSFGGTSTLPVVGDWNGDGYEEIGVYYPTWGWWFLDFNGNGLWDDGVDLAYTFGGEMNAMPVAGDWNKDGFDDIGLYYPTTGWWALDADGNGQWSDTSDTFYLFSSGETAIPIVGDWNGDGTDKIGLYHPSNGWWGLDADGNGAWSDASDLGYTFGGGTASWPIVGDWNADAITDIGVFYRTTATFYLDANGSGVWEDAADTAAPFGTPGDLPVAGFWKP